MISNVIFHNHHQTVFKACNICINIRASRLLCIKSQVLYINVLKSFKSWFGGLNLIAAYHYEFWEDHLKTTRGIYSIVLHILSLIELYQNYLWYVLFCSSVIYSVEYHLSISPGNNKSICLNLFYSIIKCTFVNCKYFGDEIL